MKGNASEAIRRVARAEGVRRPWYSEGSRSFDPDVMVNNPAAITTRVAPSFLRVGQLELFARRARSNAHTSALRELQLITEHLIARNYRRRITGGQPQDEEDHQRHDEQDRQHRQQAAQDELKHRSGPDQFFLRFHMAGIPGVCKRPLTLLRSTVGERY